MVHDLKTEHGANLAVWEAAKERAQQFRDISETALALDHQLRNALAPILSIEDRQTVDDGMGVSVNATGDLALAMTDTLTLRTALQQVAAEALVYAGAWTRHGDQCHARARDLQRVEADQAGMDPWEAAEQHQAAEAAALRDGLIG